MKKTIDYTCRYCGETNTITGFWRWLFTPHLGSKKWLKCSHCDAKRHFMARQNYKSKFWDIYRSSI